VVHLTPRPRSLLARLAHKPLAACAAVVAPLALASGVLAATTGFTQPAPHPQLTADTPAGCNTPQPRGYARCFAIVRTPADHAMTADSSGPPAGALGPADIQSAYKLPSSTAGGGQTVAIVDAYGDSDAESDLAAFRAYYGLPPCTTANGCFKKVDQTGGTNYPPDDSGWGLETSLDLQAVSSVCPDCGILLVEANSDVGSDLYEAEDEAVALGAKIVSNSWGSSEYSTETQDDENFNYPGVAITASAGDDGYGTNYPSASEYVTAVGGTTLTKDSSVPRGWTETVWDDSGSGTGSGCSAYEPQPGFQQGIPQLDAVCSNRATADVSADADPASGLGVYDTLGYNGWLQVGGTSLASPLIAATYALAGTPAAGTYPNSYPYHDPSQSSDLSDVTSGADGTCGNVLCQAGPGWDGPTGLGTPDGVKAFQGAPQGQITGQVTDASTGKPMAGVTVTAQPGDYVTRTDGNGNYNLTLAAGAYTLTAADYGYGTGTESGVQVTVNQSITANFALTAAPSGVLSGTVTDGSGHDWPLHAQITIPGYPAGSVWTSPYTGEYSVTLPQGSYTLSVSTDYPGYLDKTLQVTVGAGTTTGNITLDADLAACTAPGYGPDGITQDFAGWTGSAARDGWTVTSVGQPGPGTRPGSSRPGWRFDNPGDRTPPPHGSIPSPSDPGRGVFAYFDSDTFAVADAGYYSPRPLHTTLTSPSADLSGQASPVIGFDSAYYPDVPASQTTGNQASQRGGEPAAAVQLSTDGGRRWATVWHQNTGDALGPISIPVPQAAGHTSVEARWVFTGGGYGYWAIGAVLIGTPSCAPQPGGLVAGVVTDKTSTGPVNGAQVADTASPPPYPWPDGTSLATSDPALPGGFYWLFIPAGARNLSVGAAGYATATATVNVARDQVTHQDWTLTSAGGS
jgi:carboxypeptidase family protein